MIGDANGADKAVQSYLSERGYQNVEVYCVGDSRNNVGQWRIREVVPPHARRDFEFFSAKDEVMAREADVGLMIWDGSSFGTLANAQRLILQGKKVVVFVNPTKRLVTIRNRSDWDGFLAECDQDLQERLSRLAQPAGSSAERRAGLF